MSSLAAVLQHMESERDEALAACTRAREAEAAAAAQAQQLAAYRAEYEQRWSGRFAAGSTVTVMACYRSFMARLEQAIEQQRRQCEHLSAARVHAEARLLDCERRVAATAKLIDRRRLAEAQVAARHERKLDDELAARLARARTPPPPAFQASSHADLPR